MVDYKIAYSKEFGNDIHIFTTDEMVIDTDEDICEFFSNEELQTEFDFDINFSDDYSVNGYYLCGSDLIDSIKYRATERFMSRGM